MRPPSTRCRSILLDRASGQQVDRGPSVGALGGASAARSAEPRPAPSSSVGRRLGAAASRVPSISRESRVGQPLELALLGAGPVEHRDLEVRGRDDPDRALAVPERVDGEAHGVRERAPGS